MRIPSSIMIYRYSSLGDVAMMIPPLIAFRKRYPTIHLYIVSNYRYKALFDPINNITFVPIDFYQTNIIAIYKLFLNLKQYNPDVFLDWHDVLRSKILRFLFKINQTNVIKYSKGRREKMELINKVSQTYLPHTTERFINTFSRINLPTELDVSDIYPNKKSTNSVKRIGIAPFSKFKNKNYSIDHLKTIIQVLISHSSNIKFLFFGHGSHENSIIEDNFSNENIENTINRYSFEQELDIISSLDAMISMDSSNGHLAAMFGIKVFTIWGVTSPRLGFAPFGMPLEYSFVPDSTLYPELPVSIYGKYKNDTYQQAINSINPYNIAVAIIKHLGI